MTSREGLRARGCARLGVALLVVAVVAPPAAAQRGGRRSAVKVAPSGVPTMYLAPDLRMDGKALGMGGFPAIEFLTVGPGGRMAAQMFGDGGQLRAYDSTGKSLNWHITVGGRDSDIGGIARAGWNGNALWISDFLFNQIVPVDGQGKLGKNVQLPSWVRPSWAERRRYPLYGYMLPLALYGDGTMLVRPLSPRALLETPGFDRSLTHLMRINSDGVVQRDVAQFRNDDDQMMVRGGRRNFQTMKVPFQAPVRWVVSGDGERIVVLYPAATARDSGSFRVTMLTARGDTIFNRRYAGPDVPVTKAMADSALAKVQGFGESTAEETRRLLAAKMPAYRSFVTGMFVGLDRSTWIVTRSVSDTATVHDALILNERGDPIATARLPENLVVWAVDRAHVWGVERSKRAMARLKLQATPPPVVATPAVTPTPTPSPTVRRPRVSGGSR